MICSAGDIQNIIFRNMLVKLLISPCILILIAGRKTQITRPAACSYISHSLINSSKLFATDRSNTSSKSAVSFA